MATRQELRPVCPSSLASKSMTVLVLPLERPTSSSHRITQTSELQPSLRCNGPDFAMTAAPSVYMLSETHSCLRDFAKGYTQSDPAHPVATPKLALLPSARLTLQHRSAAQQHWPRAAIPRRPWYVPCPSPMQPVGKSASMLGARVMVDVKARTHGLSWGLACTTLKHTGIVQSILSLGPESG